MSWLFMDPVVIMKEIMFWLFKDPTVNWFNLIMPNQTVKNGLKPEKIKFPQMNFFSRKTTNKIFMYLLAPLILQTFTKILRANPELWGAPFSDPKWPICPEKKLFGANHYYYFHLPLGPFHCPKLKKILTADPELCECTIFGPKMVHLPQTKFFLENC